MSTDTLEWEKRSDYALTEMVLFILTSLVIIIAITLSFALVYLNLDGDKKFISSLLPLFENVLPSAIAFTPAKTAEVNIVFLGRQEREKKKRITRLWIQVYFVLLCFLIVFWAVSTFSSSVLYRKTTSCSDLDVEDTDLSCFLLSNDDIPEGVQQILDDEKNDIVPCDKVEDYIENQLQNSTFDLEVICYEYVLNPLAAAGIAYGAMKTIAFVIITGLSVILIVTRNYRDRERDKELTNGKILIAQAVQLFLSLMIIAVLIIVIALLHAITATRNSAFDYLRGEKFYSFSVVVLAPVTIIFTLGLFPWWAFEPLDDPTQSAKLVAIVDDKKKVTNAFHLIVHKAILQHKFSTGIDTLLKLVGGLANLPDGQHHEGNSNRRDPEQELELEEAENGHAQHHEENGNRRDPEQEQQETEQ